MNKEQKSNAPIIAIGTTLVLCVALFTGIAAYKVVEHINADADKAYAAAVTEANMRRLAQSQAEDAQNLRNIDTIPVEVTLRINVVDERQNSSQGSVSIDVPNGYTVGDMININGEWYIIARADDNPTGDAQAPDSSQEGGDSSADQPGNSGEGDSNANPDSVTINGETYVRVDDNENTGDESNTPTGNTDTTVDGDSQVPYVGAEYVTIDANGDMVYVVKRGDTLTRVSRLTGYSVQELAEYNQIVNVDLIYVDQVIRIPASQEAIDYVRSLQNGTGQ